MKEPARKFAKESVPKEKIKHFNQERKSLRFEPRQTVDDREDIQVPDTYRKNSGRPVRHEPLDASLDYKCQKLQVCYKMLTLMETMWDDTINGDFRETQSQEVGVVYEDEPEIWNFDEGSYIDIEKNEKGGEKPYARKTEERYTIS